MGVADNLKEAREKSGLSYSELSKLTGIAKSTLQRYETGTTSKIPMDVIDKISIALNISPQQLMGWDKNHKSDQETNESKDSLPSLTAKDERSIQKRLEAVLNDLMPGNGAIAYYDGEEPMSEEDKELLRISLENTMRLAKQIAKQKFTPKKYRK